jgi:hypothetical protein
MDEGGDRFVLKLLDEFVEIFEGNKAFQFSKG